MGEGIDELALGDVLILNENFAQALGGALLFGQCFFQRLLGENAGIDQDLTQFHGGIFHGILPRKSKKSNLGKQGQVKVRESVKLRREKQICERRSRDKGPQRAHVAPFKTARRHQ